MNAWDAAWEGGEGGVVVGDPRVLAGDAGDVVQCLLALVTRMVVGEDRGGWFYS